MLNMSTPVYINPTPPKERITAKANQTQVTEDGGIVKVLIKPGTIPLSSWPKGTNAIIKYKTFTYVKEEEQHKCRDKSHNHEHKQMKEGRPVRRLVGDSEAMDPGNPFELRIGYGFSVPAFEICVKTMSIGEKARFLCMPNKIDGYINLETVLRQNKKNKEKVKDGFKSQPRMGGCCASLMAMTAGDPDNADLMDLHSSPLEIEIELLRVQNIGEFQKEVWEMNNTERFTEAPIRKDEGGVYYKAGNYIKACEQYSRALMLLESLSISPEITEIERNRRFENRKIQEMAQKYKPDDIPVKEKEKITQNQLESIDPDIVRLIMQKCRLNYAACKLKIGDYPAVIQQCGEILKQCESYIPLDQNKHQELTQSNNTKIKALFRRAQACIHQGILDVAEKDLMECKKLVLLEEDEKQTSLLNEIKREEQKLQVKINVFRQKEKKMFSNMF